MPVMLNVLVKKYAHAASDMVKSKGVDFGHVMNVRCANAAALVTEPILKATSNHLGRTRADQILCTIADNVAIAIVSGNESSIRLKKINTELTDRVP